MGCSLRWRIEKEKSTTGWRSVDFVEELSCALSLIPRAVREDSRRASERPTRSYLKMFLGISPRPPEDWASTWPHTERGQSKTPNYPRKEVCLTRQKIDTMHTFPILGGLRQFDPRPPRCAALAGLNCCIISELYTKGRQKQWDQHPGWSQQDVVKQCVRSKVSAGHKAAWDLLSL